MMATQSNRLYEYEYDVFLCFNGPDTRYSFTGNLYNALRCKRFNTFMDEGQIKMGSEVTPMLLKALEGSRISIVVFSKNFASSTYCLDELVHILECKKSKSQQILPIFYDVDPSEVRHLTGSYGEALIDHECRLGVDDRGRVRAWKSALTGVSSLRGLHFEPGYEYEFIQRIVESVIQSLPRYDIFLSFCGEDTRYSFTGFLYHALSREGFKTFMDDEGLEGGSQISQTLLKAIEKSRLSIVVFSENYAYSSWCLDELVKIIECMETKNQSVWPIFYKIDQSDLTNQTKSYGHAMTAHENKYEKDSEKVQKWRSALSEAAILEGEHIKENEYESEFIKKIVEKAIDVENHL